MSTRRGGELFVRRADGAPEDADLHARILAAGRDEGQAAAAARDRRLRRLGLTEEEIRRLYVGGRGDGA